MIYIKIEVFGQMMSLSNDFFPEIVLARKIVGYNACVTMPPSRR